MSINENTSIVMCILGFTALPYEAGHDLGVAKPPAHYLYLFSCIITSSNSYLIQITRLQTFVQY